MKTSYKYCLASPGQFNLTAAAEKCINTGGSMYALTVNTATAVRPSIALTSDSEYTKGDGSYTNPYIVE